MKNVSPKRKLIVDIIGTVLGIVGGLCISWGFLDYDKLYLGGLGGFFLLIALICGIIRANQQGFDFQETGCGTVDFILGLPYLFYVIYMPIDIFVQSYRLITGDTTINLTSYYNKPEDASDLLDYLPLISRSQHADTQKQDEKEEKKNQPP